MSTLSLVITDVGRQAIVDATNTGTLPVRLSQVALGTGLWSPDSTATALQSPLKYIDTVGGQAVADDTLHVTVTDSSTDTYALGEFGLYTDGGVLFAIYSDTAGITDKATDALLLLAADIVLTSVPTGSVTVNGTGFTNPPATETVAGVAEVATQAETDAGTDDGRIVTPMKLMGAATSAATADMLMRRDSAGRAKVASPSASEDIARKDTVDAVQTNLTSHENDGSAHGATSSATANAIMSRDSAGRAKVVAPSASDDIARKDTVDAVQTNLTTHENDGGAHGATSSATANAIVSRDSAGCAKVASPSAADDIARKDTVDAVQTNLTNHENDGGAHGATSAATTYAIMRRDSAGRAKVAAPAASNDIARKDNVDAVQTNLINHENNGGAHGATSSATANAIIRRDSAGRAKVVSPSASDDIARKDTVDTVQTNLSNHENNGGAHGANSAATAYAIMRRDSAGRAKVAAPAASDDIARKDNVDAAAPVGMVAHFARSTPPTGWLKANGAAVSRTSYADLFASIGTTFGTGDGSSTFNLPDLRGEFLRGWDDSRGVDSGRVFGSPQLDQMQRMTGILEGRLALSGNNGVFSHIGEAASNMAVGSGSQEIWQFDSATSPNARVSSTTSGETRARNVALLTCIKY